MATMEAVESRLKIMSNKFNCGLIVGKFSPLHLGHEYLISSAKVHCHELMVVSYTKPDFPGYSSALKEIWLKKRFPELSVWVIDDNNLKLLCQKQGIAFSPLPEDLEPDDKHRRFVAWLCQYIICKKVDCVFTSESYGNGFAQVMGDQQGFPVKHICVDLKRSAFPVSGTEIRKDPHKYRDYLSPEVYANFVQRICLLGGESTGKTTLAEALADFLQTHWVKEYGRELWEKKDGRLVFEDMVSIAREQVRQEEILAGRANRILVCDTSPLTTLFYSQAMFGKAERELEDLATRSYDRVFLCMPDIPFVQDGTRQNDDFRMRQHQWYLDVLSRKNIPYHELTGTISERIDNVLAVMWK